jgi:cytochrome d ubiquinol oxidase subunit I
VEHRRIDNPIAVNNVLSFLIYGTTRAEVRGLDAFPAQDWPTNIPLLYFAYHIMAGLGTVFLGIMALATLLLWRGLLYSAKWMQWILMCAVPLPYIANTAGWLTAETGRQPWLVYGLVRTHDGFSNNVSSANGLFTLLGFMGLYAVLSIFLIFIVEMIVSRGPAGASAPATGEAGVPA